MLCAFQYLFVFLAMRFGAMKAAAGGMFESLLPWTWLRIHQDTCLPLGAVINLGKMEGVSHLETVEGDDITQALLRYVVTQWRMMFGYSLRPSHSPLVVNRAKKSRLNEITAKSALLEHTPPTQSDIMSPLKAQAVRNRSTQSSAHSDRMDVDPIKRSLQYHTTDVSVEEKQVAAPLSRPVTNYHLKQMGLVEKVNIYAPIQQPHEPEDQTDVMQIDPASWKQRSRARASSDPEYDEDSEYVPDDESEDEESSESSAELDSDDFDLDEDDRKLVRKAKSTKKAGTMSLIWVPVYILSFFVALLALLLVVDITQEDVQLCQRLQEATNVSDGTLP